MMGLISAGTEAGMQEVYDDFSFLALGESAPLAPTDPFTPLAVMNTNEKQHYRK